MKRRRRTHIMKRPRPPLRLRDVTVAAPHGWVGTPGFWHVRSDADDTLATRCGLSLRDGLTNRPPKLDEAVCRRCAR